MDGLTIAGQKRQRKQKMNDDFENAYDTGIKKKEKKSYNFDKIIHPMYFNVKTNRDWYANTGSLY